MIRKWKNVEPKKVISRGSFSRFCEVLRKVGSKLDVNSYSDLVKILDVVAKLANCETAKGKYYLIKFTNNEKEKPYAFKNNEYSLSDKGMAILKDFKFLRFISEPKSEKEYLETHL